VIFRRSAAARRRLTVELLADDHRTVAMTWRFVDVCPVSLRYSPLRAAEGGIVTETIAIGFERVEMA
jgi:T4-like virus tail tube protein gp19